MKKFYQFKSLFLLATELLLCSVSMAQKKFFLGGSLGFNSNQNDGLMQGPTGDYTVIRNKSYGFSVAPEFGFFLKEKVALGIRLSYANNITKAENGDITSPYYSVSPFVRFIIPLWSSRFSIYNDLGIFGSYSEATTYLMGSRETKMMQLGAFYRPGIQFRLKDNINLLATMGDLVSYNYTSQKHRYYTDPIPDMKGNYHNFGISNNYGINSFMLGVNFLF